LHRCLQRQGIRRLPGVAGTKPRRADSRLIRSASAISTSQKCRRNRASCLLDFPLAPVGGAIAANTASWQKIGANDRARLDLFFQSLQAELNKCYLALDDEEERLIGAKMTIYKPTPDERRLWGGTERRDHHGADQRGGDVEGRQALALIEKHDR